ncbi:MAG: hypothetical protein KF911_02425 [Pseudomonadales bacterium]|nr:hypothetical protein [Pseudomonadales bacterium]
MGTSLHPRFRDGVSEIESLEAKLQEMADELNDRLDLMATFRAIAQARREQFDRGGWKRWPMFDLDPEEYAECEMERLVQAESARLADLSNAYYDPHFEARSFPHLTEVDLFGALEYLPCAFLGFRFDRLEFRARETAADVGSKRGRALEEDFRKSLLAAYAEIDMSDWSSFGPKALNEAELHRGTWLVLYPDRDLQAIVPVLTSCEQEWGATWIPVQAERLLRLRDVEIISHRSASIEERIAESINDNLYELLTSSGKRLRRHPYLASSRHLRSLARRFRAGDSMEESASHE